MTSSLIPGIFALVGVTLGVILEPVKSFFAERTRGRQERADRCANLIQAATRSRALLLALNGAQRRKAAGLAPDDIDADDIVRQYRAARADLRHLVPLLVLSGPDELAEAGDMVLEADRDLRAQRFSVDPDPTRYEEDLFPQPVQQAARKLQEEITRFAKLARKFVR